MTGAVANTVHLGNLTANLNINYRRPIPANTYVLVRTRVTRVERRKIYLTASVEDGTAALTAGAAAPPVVYADASALYVMMAGRHRASAAQIGAAASPAAAATIAATATATAAPPKL